MKKGKYTVMEKRKKEIDNKAKKKKRIQTVMKIK